MNRSVRLWTLSFENCSILKVPLAGLDIQNRPKLLEILRALHAAKAPRVILGLRTQDPIPEWITHVAFVDGSNVVAGPKDDVVPKITHVGIVEDRSVVQTTPPTQGKTLVDMQNVNVKYGPRSVSLFRFSNRHDPHLDITQVLKDINWQIRQGERWHLQGSNGNTNSLCPCSI